MTPTPPDDCLDEAALAELAEDLGADFPAFVRRFVSGAERALDEVEAALAAGDTGGASERAHALKGTAGYLGATALAARLGDLQDAATARAAGEATGAAARAREALAAVVPRLRERAGAG